MNVLLLSPALFCQDGGIERILRLYLRALGDVAGPGGRVDSVVLADDSNQPPALAGYRPDGFREHVACAGRRLRFVRETLRLAGDADLLVCGHLHLLPVAWLARALRRRPAYVLVAHGIEVWRPFGPVERRALAGAARIVCVSDFTRRQLLRFAPDLDPTRLVVVPNALDPVLAAAPASSTATPFALPRILTVGRLARADAYKGFDVLIEALARVRREHPAARLRVVGDGDDRARLEALAARLGVAGSVDFLGRVNDAALAAEYAACDFFALPSRREGFGLVYLEAMHHGKACIAARAGGAPEVVTPATGELPDYGNVDALAAAIRELVRHPRDSEVVRRHAAGFLFPAFSRRLSAALAPHG